VPERIFLMIGLAISLWTACATSGAGGAGSTSDPASTGITAAGPALDRPLDRSVDRSPDRPVEATQAIPAVPLASCEARVGADRLRRSAIKRTVDAGLGRWLQTVSIDPMMARGRFRGWIIRSLDSSEGCYADVDLHAGDVVTRVNGRSIERPEEALEVWTGLPASAELVVDFVRDGQARTLRFGIVDR
jgi:hypothetical protein